MEYLICPLTVDGFSRTICTCRPLGTGTPGEGAGPVGGAIGHTQQQLRELIHYIYIGSPSAGVLLLMMSLLLLNPAPLTAATDTV